MTFRPLRWLGLAAAVLLLIVAVFAVNFLAFRPFSLDLFYEKYLLQAAIDSPETLTSIGLLEQYGYRRHNAHLDDLSLEKTERDVRTARKYLDQLRAYDFADQTPDQQVSTRVLESSLVLDVDGAPFRYHRDLANQMDGVQGDTIDFLLNQHLIDDERGAQDYLSRLEELPRKFGQLTIQLQERERRGVLPPQFVFDRVLDQMRSLESPATKENVLYAHLVQRLDELKAVSTADRESLLTRAEALIERAVRPAFREFIAVLEDQRKRAGTDDGVWHLPQGEAYYAHLLKVYTTTDLTPEQVHERGIENVARIEGEMRAILTAQNELRPGESPSQAMRRLGTDPRFLYSDDDAGRDAALADYTRLVEEQQVFARRVIGLQPKAKIEVRRVPAFKESGSNAYYTIPAADGSRPGIFWANLRDMKTTPKFSMRTLAAHEGVPGHHTQVALSVERTGGPTFRRFMNFTAYAEGWGLYAEWLTWRGGVYAQDPWGDLGRLQWEVFRAARLVVDTGIHHKRWTREQAIAWMLEHTGVSEGEITQEIERYIVMPGQACAYAVGMLRIQDARSRAEAAFEAGFDEAAERDFHDVVLREGAVPLSLLDQQVDAWIASRSRH
ncbi:MAG: DUF885 domain-containing protein [Steroidobacteraceae bacterium]